MCGAAAQLYESVKFLACHTAALVLLLLLLFPPMWH
jgi:hypothetical protein